MNLITQWGQSKERWEMSQGGYPHLLSWVTTTLLFKVHPSFLLPFLLFPSHEGSTIWRDWLRCAGESFTWAIDQASATSKKEGKGRMEESFFVFLKNILYDTSHLSPISPLLCFLSFFRRLKKLSSRNRSHYMPLYTLRLSLFHMNTHINTTENRVQEVLWVQIKIGRMVFV